jgi:hypothetical protein
MSLVTVEVQLDHGRVIPKGNEPLPEKATALLTILEEAPKAPDPEQKPAAPSEFDDFLAKWQGKLELREDKGDDPA